MDRQALYAWISRQQIAVVSSVSIDGAPQSAVVGVAVTPDLELIFDTLDTTRKYRNIQRDDRVSAVLWAGEATAQIEGKARILAGRKLAEYQAIYFDAFPDGRARQTWPGIAYVCITPHRIRFSDFGVPLPVVMEFDSGL